MGERRSLWDDPLARVFRSKRAVPRRMMHPAEFRRGVARRRLTNKIGRQGRSRQDGPPGRDFLIFCEDRDLGGEWNTHQVQPLFSDNDSKVVDGDHVDFCMIKWTKSLSTRS